MATAETARLVASLELQDRNFTRGLSKVEAGIGRVDRRLGAFSGFLNRNLSRAIDSIAARGVTALGDAIQAGSDLNEEITKAQAVFGDASKSVIAFSETTSGALGLAQADALAAAGNFGNMFKTIGLAEEASAGMSQRLVTLAADMASFNNTDPTEMLDRIRSGLAGEAEPLRRFGVLLSAARVQEEAYASGIAKRGEKLTEQQKVQARYNLILKDTAVQQGDVAKTGGNLAGQQRKLNAMLRDVSATVGTALLPAITDLTAEFVKLLSDPATKAGIQAFAKDLGKGAKDFVASLKGVNWKAFASALGAAAGFAKDLVTAFLGLPPWVQTAVITGWGLNKLTGGAVTGIVGELGKGLIKGVLGMNAGVVNINAGVVNGAGGIGGLAGAGGKGGIKGLLGAGVRLILPIGIGLAIADALYPAVRDPLMDIADALGLPGRNPDKFRNVGTPGTGPQQRGKTITGDEIKTLGQKTEKVGAKTDDVKRSVEASKAAAAQNSRNLAANQQRLAAEQKAVTRAGTVTVSGVTRQVGANVRQVSPPITSTLLTVAAMITGAIWASGAANRPIIQPTNVIEQYTTVVRTGSPSGSRKSGPLE